MIIKTQIINGDASANKAANGMVGEQSSTFNAKAFNMRAIAAMAIVLVSFTQLCFAQNPSGSIPLSNHSRPVNYLTMLITRNTSAGFLTTRFPDLPLQNSVSNTNNPGNFFKARFNTIRHAGLGLFGEVAAMTTVPFFIPAGNGRLKACLSLKRDGITIQPKGPANFHYVAIDLKIKF